MRMEQNEWAKGYDEICESVRERKVVSNIGSSHLDGLLQQTQLMTQRQPANLVFNPANQLIQESIFDYNQQTLQTNSLYTTNKQEMISPPISPPVETMTFRDQTEINQTEIRESSRDSQQKEQIESPPLPKD